ncbi:MAG TPA: sulfite exporter TauE/SafE family protein [Thermodesulfobacteriaceae bacterium]|nr:sulfite exporter TauE/SafE family protein [Thermodesulfobacteriaceae bacterium]
MSNLILMPVVFFISLVLTMVGLGGGLIFAPLFVVLDFDVGMAVSTSLFLNGIAAVGAAITYLRKKMVDFRMALPLLITSSLSAPAGAFAVSGTDRRFFLAVLAGIVFVAAVRMLFSKRPQAEIREVGAVWRVAGGTIIGLMIGLIAGFLGIGGGVFIVPLLIYLLRVPAKTAAATSIFIVVFSSFAGFLGHVSVDDVDWRFLSMAALFSFAGGQMGSRIMVKKLQGAAIKRVFGLVLLFFCLKLLHKMWIQM